MPEIPARRIALIRTSALGDVIRALPLVNGLRRGYPDAEITWIIHSLPFELVRYQRAVDEFIVFPRGAAGWRLLRRQLARREFDLLLVPQTSFKGHLISWLVRAPIKLGFDRGRSREFHYFFVNRHLPRRPEAHAQEHYLEFLDYLDIPREPVRWDLVFTEEELARRDAFFASLRRPAVSLVLASSRPAKDWHPAGFAAVAEHLVRELHMVPLLVGGPSRRERELAEAVASLCSVPVVPALDGPVRETLLKLSGSRVVVAPDTGPLHAAVALGVPTVGLFGFSDPRLCGPYRFRELLVDRFSDPGEDPDRPLIREARPGRMAAITPAEVITRIHQALGLPVSPGRPQQPR